MKVLYMHKSHQTQEAERHVQVPFEHQEKL